MKFEYAPPPEVIRERVDEFHTMFLNSDECPGLVIVKGGKRANSLRLTQEPRTFKPWIYYNGFTIPYWDVEGTVWTQEQWKQAVRLHAKYAPNPIKKLSDLTAIQVTHPVLNENGYRMFILAQWEPMSQDKKGLFKYQFRLVQAFPVRFVPKKGKQDSEDNTFGMPQWEDAEIEPKDEKGEWEPWASDFDKATYEDDFNPVPYYMQLTGSKQGAKNG